MPKSVAFVEYVIWLALIWPCLLVVRYLEHLGCPSDAFICGSTSNQMTSWAGLVRVALLVVALSYPARIMLYFATRNHLLRKKFDNYYKSFDLGTTTFRAAMVMVIVIPAIYLLTFEKIWASADAINEQKFVWSAPVSRSWSDVVAVSTWCVPGSRGSWNEGYDVIFRDRGDVDLTAGADPITDHKTAIFAALRGRRFDFDHGAVDKACLSAFRDMATQHP